jgi:hypothetical protein
MIEPDIRVTIYKRDAVIFHDNDFEIFLDPDFMLRLSVNNGS